MRKFRIEYQFSSLSSIFSRLLALEISKATEFNSFNTVSHKSYIRYMVFQLAIDKRFSLFQHRNLNTECSFCQVSYGIKRVPISSFECEIQWISRKNFGLGILRNLSLRGTGLQNIESRTLPCCICWKYQLVFTSNHTLYANHFSFLHWINVENLGSPGHWNLRH